MNPYITLALIAGFSAGFVTKQIELHHTDRYMVTVSKPTFQLAENLCGVNGGVIEIAKRPLLVDRFTFSCENGAEFKDTWVDFRPVTNAKEDHLKESELRAENTRLRDELTAAKTELRMGWGHGQMSWAD